MNSRTCRLYPPLRWLGWGWLLSSVMAGLDLLALGRTETRAFVLALVVVIVDEALLYHAVVAPRMLM